VTLIAICFGVAEMTFMRYTRQRRVQLELEQAKATVITETVKHEWLVAIFGEERLQKVIHVTLNEDVADEHLKLLHQLPDLQRHNVGTLPANRQDTFQEGMVWVGRCTSLETLFLVDTKVTDNGLKHLAELSHLRVLWLSGSNVIMDGVRALRKQLPSAYIHFSPKT
jgi:hypothetical protein